MAYSGQAANIFVTLATIGIVDPKVIAIGVVIGLFSACASAIEK